MSKTEKDKYTIRGRKKLSVRLSENDLEGLEKIRVSGEFKDISEAVRWVIHFTVAMLRIIPLAVVEGFARTDAGTEEIIQDDKMEKPTEKVSDQDTCCQYGQKV